MLPLLLLSLLLLLQDVEELICWHEDFDSREYTRSSQRHAATLEHGQREIRSIVGSVLLSQLRTNYHNHLAQVRLGLRSNSCFDSTRRLLMCCWWLYCL